MRKLCLLLPSLCLAAAPGETSAPALADGLYQADFETDSSMFGANETCNGKGTLTVEGGAMTLHVSLRSKNILNLYPGLARDAQKQGAALLEPTLDTVTYSDGLTEEVYGFDIPVPAIEEEFDLALVGTKGTWYDHRVSVRAPQPLESRAAPADGSYTCALTLAGGSGRAALESPALLRVEDGAAVATLVWSSPYYDYMVLDGVRYSPVNTGGELHL